MTYDYRTAAAERAEALRDLVDIVRRHTIARSEVSRRATDAALARADEVLEGIDWDEVERITSRDD